MGYRDTRVLYEKIKYSNCGTQYLPVYARDYPRPEAIRPPSIVYPDRFRGTQLHVEFIYL